MRECSVAEGSDKETRVVLHVPQGNICATWSEILVFWGAGGVS